MTTSPHKFHIPVMGIGFTIDTPIHVAPFGITSVLSTVDDMLMESMREYHSRQTGREFTPIKATEEDSRARRMTAYLNLLQDIVNEKTDEVRQAPFESGSLLCQYFEMLPESPLRTLYNETLACTDEAEKAQKVAELRKHVVAGGIDVNIMTYPQRPAYKNGEKLPIECTDTFAALRGYAKSKVSPSGIVFSAGLAPLLYGYITEFDDFFVDETGKAKKNIILKVADFRSAMIQGKFLAKKGLWVHEFRIESGINCGGHAFIGQGVLMGPVLEEFRARREELRETLYKSYKKTMQKEGRVGADIMPETRVTAQGGISTCEEREFLQTHYELSSTGWGSPFLLAPDVTNVDDENLQALLHASKDDVFLSDSSPLGVRFWNLRTSASEKKREERIAAGTPGSPCFKKYSSSNTEFTDEPICIASRQYMQLKLPALDASGESKGMIEKLKQTLLGKSCICHDLSGGATRKYNIDPTATPAICSGPGILGFRQLTTLREMVGHIYGWVSLLSESDWPHMFVRELRLYVEYLQEELSIFAEGLSSRNAEYFETFRENLLIGIDYYQKLAEDHWDAKKDRFLQDLTALRQEIEALLVPTQEPSPNA